jgi:hypothetical protein
MYLTASSSVWRRYLAAVFVCTMVQCLPAYAAGSGKVLKIDPRDVTGIQNMPEEIASMMEELGYEWMSVHDDAGDDAQDEYSQSRFQKLRERMTLEFGADNVSEGHSFFTP